MRLLAFAVALSVHASASVCDSGCVALPGDGKYCYSKEHTCPSTTMRAIATKDECRVALQSFGFTVSSISDYTLESYPKGCFAHGESGHAPYFNTNGHEHDNDASHTHVICEVNGACGAKDPSPYPTAGPTPKPTPAEPVDCNTLENAADANVCHHSVAAGYCQHTYVSWMEENCARQCCLAEDGGSSSSGTPAPTEDGDGGGPASGENIQDWCASEFGMVPESECVPRPGAATTSAPTRVSLPTVHPTAAPVTPTPTAAPVNCEPETSCGWAGNMKKTKLVEAVEATTACECEAQCKLVDGANSWGFIKKGKNISCECTTGKKPSIVKAKTKKGLEARAGFW